MKARGPEMDAAQVWTMVYNQPIRRGGHIQRVEVFGGATGRRLKLGTYRPDRSNLCRFRLIQEYIVDSIPLGFSTVNMFV